MLFGDRICFPPTSRVCDLHTQHKHKCSVVRSCEIVADQPAYAMLGWDEAEAKSTSKVGQQEYQDEDTTAVLETVIQEDTGQN